MVEREHHLHAKYLGTAARGAGYVRQVTSQAHTSRHMANGHLYVEVPRTRYFGGIGPFFYTRGFLTFGILFSKL